jgi:hypothetical protein
MQPAVPEMQATVCMWIFVVALSLALATVRPLVAQFPPELTVRTRVRVLVSETLRETGAPGKRWVHGELAAVATDTLYIRVDSGAPSIPISRTAIQRIDRSLGVRRPSACPPVGPLISTAVMVLGLVLRWDKPDDFGAMEATFIVGAFWGGVINALSRTECWRRVRFR